MRMQLRSSTILAVWIIVWPLVVAIAIWFSALPWGVTFAIDCGIGVYAWMAWQQHVAHFGRPILAFSDGHWWWRQQGEQCQLRLLNEYYFSSWLIVLIFVRMNSHQLWRKKLPVIILPDSTSADECRQLRVFLRFGLPKSVINNQKDPPVVPNAAKEVTTTIDSHEKLV